MCGCLFPSTPPPLFCCTAYNSACCIAHMCRRVPLLLLRTTAQSGTVGAVSRPPTVTDTSKTVPSTSVGARPLWVLLGFKVLGTSPRAAVATMAERYWAFKNFSRWMRERDPGVAQVALELAQGAANAEVHATWLLFCDCLKDEFPTTATAMRELAASLRWGHGLGSNECIVTARKADGSAILRDEAAFGLTERIEVIHVTRTASCAADGFLALLDELVGRLPEDAAGQEGEK